MIAGAITGAIWGALAGIGIYADGLNWEHIQQYELYATTIGGFVGFIWVGALVSAFVGIVIGLIAGLPGGLIFGILYCISEFSDWFARQFRLISTSMAFTYGFVTTMWVVTAWFGVGLPQITGESKEIYNVFDFLISPIAPGVLGGVAAMFTSQELIRYFQKQSNGANTYVQ